MKMEGFEHASLDICIHDDQRERIGITRNGKPVALVVGVEGMDWEQLQLGSAEPFWAPVADRRMQEMISRSELERNIAKEKAL